MSKQSDFYGSVYSTAKELGATDTQAQLAAAQASQETGYGQHVVGNNYFGVKASPSYAGPTVTANTSEGEDAVSNRMDQSFRAYDGLKSSVANYMDVMARAFPDAWNATNIADAAKGLVSGKFGRYAKDLDYPSKIQSIASKQKYAYAQNPENVPVPYSPEEDPLANSPQAQAIDGMSGLLNPVTTQAVETSQLAAPGEWGINNGVTPHLGTIPETWSAMAAAKPVQAPMSSAQPSGLLGSAPVDGFSEMASAGPMGLLSSPNISQADISRALSNVTTRNEFDPSFTAGLMAPNNPVVPTAVETSSYTPSGLLSAPEPNVTTSRFATPEATSRFPTVAIDQTRMPMSIDPATNTQSFMDAPQTAVATGINSPEHKQIQAMAEQQLAATRAVQPSVNIPTGLLADQAINPSLPSLSVPTVDAANAYAATPSITPAAQAINSIIAPSDMMRELPGYHVNPLDGNIVPDKAFQAPALETVSVPNQPTIEGPASTEVAPAQEQQQTQQTQQAISQATAPQTMTMGDKLKAAVNPGTAIGGLLGGVTMGPIGGLLGGLLGNAVNQGSFSGLLGGPALTGGFIGSGPQAAYSVWGGGTPAGTSALASNGSQVTSQGNGWTTSTNAQGVTSSTSPWGGGAGWYGGDPNDPESYV